MSFLFSAKAAAKFARRSLLPVVFASVMAIGAYSQSDAALVVSLTQSGSVPVAVPGQQTVVPMLLEVYSDDGSPATFNTDAFNTKFVWQVADGNASVTDLYNVNASSLVPLAAASSSTAIPSTIGMYFVDGEAQVRQLNVVGVAADNGRNILLETAINGTFATLDTSTATAGSPVTVAQIYFAVEANRWGTFNFTIDDSTSEGFSLPGGSGFVNFTNGGGTLQVVPEPNTMYSLFAVGLVVTGCQVRRLRRKAA